MSKIWFPVVSFFSGSVIGFLIGYTAGRIRGWREVKRRLQRAGSNMWQSGV